MSDKDTIPQNKPPFEHTELYANMVHAYYQRKASVQASAEISVEFLDKFCADFRDQRHAIYTAMSERIEDLAAEHYSQVDEMRQRYERGEL